ncbi:MAG: class I SAM-dependent methyltransferase family protein [Thermoproteota archaeon]|nr:class I SAM-dependent methyltransferase family protein [Thermoproteota archaeon]
MSTGLKAPLDDVSSTADKCGVLSSYDIIGDIIIIKIPESLINKKYSIGTRLLELNKSAKSVFLQTSSVEGDFRLRKLELLAGIDHRITEHREYGCRFVIDVGKVYFSPRLSTERQRIASSVKNHETVTNMFAGVGTFSILIAKKNHNSKILSIDSNPRACLFCNINARLNKVQDRVFAFCGDARYLAEKVLSGVSDRVLMPLPEKAGEYADSAVKCLRHAGGRIHFFTHVRGENKKNAVYNGTLSATNAFKRYDHTVIYTRVVREVGPRLYQTTSEVEVIK